MLAKLTLRSAFSLKSERNDALKSFEFCCPLNLNVLKASEIQMSNNDFLTMPVNYS